MNTNFANLKHLLEQYHPETMGVVTHSEQKLIEDTLEVKDMSVLDLRNLRDFVVLFFSCKDRSVSDLDRMSAITCVIDHHIFSKGGEV